MCHATAQRDLRDLGIRQNNSAMLVPGRPGARRERASPAQPSPPSAVWGYQQTGMPPSPRYWPNQSQHRALSRRCSTAAAATAAARPCCAMPRHSVRRCEPARPLPRLLLAAARRGPAGWLHADLAWATWRSLCLPPPRRRLPSVPSGRLLAAAAPNKQHTQMETRPRQDGPAASWMSHGQEMRAASGIVYIACYQSRQPHQPHPPPCAIFSSPLAAAPRRVSLLIRRAETGTASWSRDPSTMHSHPSPNRQSQVVFHGTP